MPALPTRIRSRPRALSTLRPARPFPQLCVAKLAADIENGTTADEFPSLLLRPGKRAQDDDFVEVHIGGSVTARTLEKVIVTRGDKRRRSTIVKALKEKLKQVTVTLES